MAVLRAIGNFFVRIGRWIRDTAWVQPLLIVGAIFGLIFSIPSIVKGVQSIGKGAPEYQKFYNSYAMSLKNAEKGTSEVDKLFEAIDNGTANELVGADKFFLSFVKKDCTVCEDQYKGYKVLTKNWGKGEFVELKGEKFKMVTVFIDKEQEIKKEQKNLFKYVWSNHSSVFEKLTENYERSEYAQFKGYQANCNSFNNLFEADDNNNFKIEAPTTFLFDYNSKAEWSWDGNDIEGLSEIMFSVYGDSDYEKARFLSDAWNHTGVFADHNYYAD